MSGISRAGQSTVRRPSAIWASVTRQPEMPGRGDGEGGVFDLVRADKCRQRQVEQAVLVLIDQAAMLLA